MSPLQKWVGVYVMTNITIKIFTDESNCISDVNEN